MKIGTFTLKCNYTKAIKKHREHLQNMIDSQHSKNSNNYIESSFETAFISNPNPKGVEFSTPNSSHNPISLSDNIVPKKEIKNAEYDITITNSGIFSYCILFKNQLTPPKAIDLMTPETKKNTYNGLYVNNGLWNQ